MEYKQFNEFFIKFETLPPDVRLRLIEQFTLRAEEFCRRSGYRVGGFNISSIKGYQIPFSFIVTIK